jgi:transmembrane sensor
MKRPLPALREPYDEGRAHANWARIQERRARRPRPWLVGGALATVLASAAAWMLAAPAPAPVALTRADGAPCLGPIEERAVRLDDGSSIVLDEATDLEVLENDGERMRLWMRVGAADFDVTPGGPRRWTIETGQVSVEVLGTSFRVARHGTDVTVTVRRGVVLVRGPTTPDGLARLTAGGSLTVPGEVVASHPVEVADAVDVAPLAADDEASEAIPSIEAGTAPPRRTLAEADELRRAGRIEEARAVLRAISRDRRAGADAALAAFTLGRLEHEQLHDPRAAAAAFGRAIALGLPEPLVEDARARRAQSLAAIGDRAALEAAVRDYLAHHATGRRRAEVERWLEAP